MICTPVTLESKNYDVVWKRGKDGPKISDVYVHNTETLARGWELRRDEFAAALQAALPTKKLHR